MDFTKLLVFLIVVYALFGTGILENYWGRGWRWGYPHYGGWRYPYRRARWHYYRRPYYRRLGHWW